MIKAELFVKDKKIVGFHLTGHSGMEEYGKDVLCAFVSSAAYMTEYVQTHRQVPMTGICT